jgi:hypothetical protein
MKRLLPLLFLLLPALACAGSLQPLAADDVAALLKPPAHGERINFLLDPHWGGETPRVLVIRADGSRLGISGALTPAQLRKLL